MNKSPAAKIDLNSIVEIFVKSILKSTEIPMNLKYIHNQWHI